jgi:glycosyltransferase involved in cell wall biosynthesis
MPVDQPTSATHSESHGDATQPVVVFFARVKDRKLFELVEFYAQDIEILRRLGYRVHIVTRVRDLRRAPVPVLYFVWWWTFAAFPVALARLVRRPVVITGVFDEHEYPARPLHQRALISFAARHATSNVFVSQLERDAVAKRLALTSAHMSPLIVDGNAYRPDGERDPDLLLSFALMDRGNSIRKCTASSIRALATMLRTRPSLRLVIGGKKGSDYPGLAALAQSLGVGDRVEFLGLVSREEKIRLLQRCGVYLQPSQFEGFGLAGLEAMACGAPVVTSPVGAVPEVGGDAVVYVDGDDPSAISAAALSLLDDPRRAADLSARCRARAVEQFSMARRVADLRAILDQARAAAR